MKKTLALLLISTLFYGYAMADSTDRSAEYVLNRVWDSSSNTMKASITSNSTTPATITRTEAPGFAGDAALRTVYQYAIGAGEIPFSTNSYLKNTGSTAASGGSHAVGAGGWAEDTVNGKIPLVGVEGRVDAHGSQNIFYYGVVGDPIWTDPDPGNTTTFGGSLASITAQRYVYANNGVTPRNQGTIYGVYIPDVVGGSLSYGLFTAAQTGATLNVSARIDSGSLYTLQIGGEADNTGANSGIFWGASSDTNLYRSAANTLRTDDAFIAAGGINGSTIGASSAADATFNTIRAATNYRSSDGTAGFTGSCGAATTATVKNGLIVSCA